MKRFSKLVSVATIALAAATGSAFAADWEGAYGGIYYGADIGGAMGSDLAGIQLGYNWDNGATVYGIEGELGWYTSWGDTAYALTGRLGYEISDSFLLFGLAGFGGTSTGIQFWDVGAGAQVMVGQSAYVRADYNYWIPTDGLAPNASVLKLAVGMQF